MRGERFSESQARQSMASLPDKWLATFIAMDAVTRDVCIEKFNAFFAKYPTYVDRYSIEKVRKT